MSKEQLVKYLRSNVNIQASGTTDTAYLSMSDEDIELYLEIVLTRDFPDVASLDYVPTEDIYALILLSKKELYFTLATVSAPDYDLSANGASLSRTQRFEHYMELIKQCDEEYNSYYEQGGTGRNTLTSYDVVLTERAGTHYNYEHGFIENPIVIVDDLGTDYISITWKHNTSKFLNCRLYLSKSPIVDLHLVGSHIDSTANLVETFTDSQQKAYKFSRLEKGVTYYLAVVIMNTTGLTGFKQMKVTTLSE
jgi:hypothetical protein